MASQEWKIKFWWQWKQTGHVRHLRIHATWKAQLGFPPAAESQGGHSWSTFPHCFNTPFISGVNQATLDVTFWRAAILPLSSWPRLCDCITLPMGFEFHICCQQHSFLKHFCNTNYWLGFWFHCWWISFQRYKSESLFWFLHSETVPYHYRQTHHFVLTDWHFFPHLHFSTTVMTDAQRSHEE